MNLLRLPVPTPRQAAMIVLVALSVGIVAGRAIGSGSAAAHSPVMLAEAPPEAVRGGGDPGATEVGVELSAPEGNVEPAPAPEAPEPAPAPAEPAPASEPSEPVDEQPPADDAPPDDEPRDEPQEQTAQITGTVVQVNPAAHGYALATAEGDVIAVHARQLPEAGELVDLDVLELANGTRREVTRTETGADPTAKLRGTVTFVAPDQLGYVVSARGASLLVRSAAGRPLPALLDLVTVAVRFADPQPGLVEESLQVDGRASGAVDLHGTIENVDPLTRTLVLPADDLDQAGLDISVAVPAELDLAELEVGGVIAATVELGSDGSYRLTAADADDDAKAANRAD